MRSFKIRLMAPQDVPEATEIERSCFSTPWSELAFYKEIYNPRSLCLVAETEEGLAGYICMSRILEECHILNLAVHPLKRRQGIGSALIKEALNSEFVSSCRYIYLEVRASNMEARRLYEKFGFKVVGIRRAYYINPVEDALIMMLER
ncbi:MAG: ribosomal protein S18-alanine N-acetyltransferase [Thermodesulfovibrionales bacterium]|nr:ribosomal protein S18-alanine N-acetyltransferase [Thermodesulfovibrionales bacterium]